MTSFNSFMMIMVVCVAAADICLGVVVLQRNSHSFTNRAFASAAALMALWIVANYLSDQVVANQGRLVFLNRLTVAAGIVGAVMMFAFGLSFPHRRARISPGWKLALIFGGVLAILCVTTPLLVADVTRETWGTNITLGPAYLLFVVWGVACGTALAADAFHRYRAATPREQVQFRWLYLGLGSFFLVTILLTGILPYVAGNNRAAQLTPFASLLFLMPMAYAMLRFRLLDVGWSAVRGAAYSLALAVAAAMLVVAAGRWMDMVFAPIGVDPRLGLFVVGLAAILGFAPTREAIDKISERFLRQRTYDPDTLLRGLRDIVSTTLDPEAVSSIITEDLAREMKLAFVSVAYFRGDKPLVVTAGPGRPVADLRELLDFPYSDGALVADELDAGDAALSAMASCDARVAAPLQHSGKRLGVIVLGHKLSGRTFSDSDLRFLEILAAEAGAALRNATLFDELNQRVRELSALNQLASAIGADIELDAVLRNALEQAVAVTTADAGSIMLLDDDGTTLEIAAAIGLSDEVVATSHERVGEGIAGWVASRREPVIIVNGNDERFKSETVRSEVSCAIAVPALFKDEVIGVINLSRKQSPGSFTTENLNVVTSFAGQLAVAVKNARLYGDLEKTFLGTISSLAAAVDAKDPYTYGHSTEVTEYADLIGQKMELPERDRHTLHIAATLHDIGKIGVDSSTLRKPGRLNDAERAEMERHPSIAADILAPLDFLRDTVPLILFHHERFSGGGYPSGVSGRAIPLGARIISVADAFNAMVSDRPYRAGLPWAAAIQELRDNSGTQFDPAVVGAFLEVLAERGELAPPELRVVSLSDSSELVDGAAASI